MTRPEWRAMKFAATQIEAARRELSALKRSLEVRSAPYRSGPIPEEGKLKVIDAYLVDAEVALDDAITESPPPESHGERRRLS
jgi:hypothetical protein